MRRFYRFAIFSLISLFTITLCSCADHVYHGSQPAYLSSINNHVAIKGYDPVAYFRSHSSTLGHDQYRYDYAGKTWYFTSIQNRMAFMKNPHRYIPQYNGYSAYDLANGVFTEGDPRSWQIVSGKLYLNRSPAIKAKWQRNPTIYIKQADQYWRHYLGLRSPNTRISSL